MIEYIAIGGGLAFAAAVQPGPFQAYLFSSVTAIGWRRTLPAALAPLLTDGPIALLALMVLGQLSPPMQGALRIAGALLLLVLGWRALQQWRHGQVASPGSSGKIPRTLLEAALVNALNPNPYLGWALVLGPVVVAAWQEEPTRAVAVVAAFYLTMVAMSVLLIVAFGSARLLGKKLQRVLLLASAIVLAGIAVYQLAAGVSAVGVQRQPASTGVNHLSR